VMAHAGGARGEDRQVGAARTLDFELRAFEALADLIVGDREPLGRCRRRPFREWMC